ncbi:MAG TPA: YeeE/YedE family protein [Vicinamibacterales bacterium]|nr:YeeE/YedE family protein [Vicinamibacterales bacterium]
MSTVANTISQPAAAILRGSSAPVPTAMAVAATALMAVYLAGSIGPRQAVLFLVGVAAGVVLYHAAFGFTSAWRVFISNARGAGVRAQMVMLALTCAVFFPLLSAGELLGQPMRGSISPAGVAVLAGAFMFGIGMQLGGGCASGTLYTVGGGSLRMVVTLLAFILGSVIGTAHVPWWQTLPAFAPASLVTMFGALPAFLINLVVFGAIAWLTIAIERRRHGRAENLHGSSYDTGRWLRGPWPLFAGAVGLATVNIATLTIAGRPWGVTSAFALWGAKAFNAVGIDVASWPYWTTPAQAAALKSNVLLDVTTVMDIGIILGALVAAILANRFAPRLRASGRSLVAAVGGGLLLGYGARIAYGCNIGAYFSGIASGSFHGWLWLVAAFAGNALGVRLRPLCDLPVERTNRL